jgi:hypothetical protein
VSCWVPGDTGLPGNEASHLATKWLLCTEPSLQTALGSDVHTCLHRTVLSSW